MRALLFALLTSSVALISSSQLPSEQTDLHKAVDEKAAHDTKKSQPFAEYKKINQQTLPDYALGGVTITVSGGLAALGFAEIFDGSFWMAGVAFIASAVTGIIGCQKTSSQADPLPKIALPIFFWVLGAAGIGHMPEKPNKKSSLDHNYVQE